MLLQGLAHDMPSLFLVCFLIGKAATVKTYMQMCVWIYLNWYCN